MQELGILRYYILQRGISNNDPKGKNLLTLSTEIEKHINKLVHPLKDEEALLECLKIKMTKKELKLLKAWAEGTDLEIVQKDLNLDETRYAELSVKLIKKLNQEKIKQAICL